MIVGLSGFIGSGKSTVAGRLVREHGFTEIAFADTLKDVCSLLFDWPRDMLQGDSSLTRQWRDKVDEWWASRLKRPGFSPRRALQIIGTEVLRGGFDDNIWILSVERKLETTAGNIVVTDCRFPNEIAMLRRRGALMAKVKRGPDPHWLPMAQTAMAGLAEESEQAWDELTENLTIHPSEFSWVNESFDHTFINEFTVDVLDKEIDKWVKEQQGLYLAKAG